MKTYERIKEIILDFARTHSDVRAVLLNGSRANPNIPADDFQDFDVRFAVRNFDIFIKDHSWTSVFGEKILEQLPETFSFGEKTENFFSYLMLFKDGFRIDLSVIPVEKIDDFNESLTVIWLDKDALFENLPETSDRDFWVKKPDEKWFQEVCNEFWWVSTYVAKGLARNEIPFAIKYLEEILRPMFTQMIDWNIGVEYDFKISTGKSGKFYPNYLGEKNYSEFLKTYSDAQPENVWTALFKMIGIFSETAKLFSRKMNFHYKISEEENVIAYLNGIKNLTVK